MFTSLRSHHRVPGMVLRVTANRDRMNFGIGQHGAQLGMAGDFRAVTRAHLRRIQLARRPYSRHPGKRSGIDRRDMSARHPTVADYPNVIFFACHIAKAVAQWHPSFARECQSKTRKLSELGDEDLTDGKSALRS